MSSGFDDGDFMSFGDMPRGKSGGARGLNFANLFGNGAQAGGFPGFSYKFNQKYSLSLQDREKCF